MKVIIGGTPESQFLHVTDAFEKSGLTVGVVTSLQDLDDVPSEAGIISIGEAFAADVLERLTGELDDSAVLFLYSRPEYVLQHAITYDEDIEVQIGAWEQTARVMLKSFKKHRDRTVLVHGPTALSLPKEFTALCRDRLELDLPDDLVFARSAAALEKSSTLSKTVAAQWAAASHELREISGELEACAVPLGDAPPEFFSSAREAAREYQVLNERILELEQAKVSLENLQQDSRQLKDAEEENELLLLQLHQVQEELESYYLEAANRKELLAENNRELEKRQQENDALLAKLHTAETSLAEKQKSLVDVKKQETQTVSQVHELEEENELLLMQLHQVQEELESYYLEAKSLREKNSSITTYEMTELAEYAKQLEKKYIMLLKSRSWKIMAPTREIGRLIKSVVRRKRVPRNRFPKRPEIMDRIVGERPAKRKGK